jgi:WD40 repeat protein
LAGTAAVDSGANAVATNAMANILAVGCEDGSIYVYKITDESNDFDLVGICKGHLKAVCSVSFCLRRNIFVSSAKDGMAKVWNYQTLECIATLECQVPPPPKSANKRAGPQQILVRGCAFGDLEGNVIYTVASARRGQAYLYKWTLENDGKNYTVFERIEASPVPISAMSQSADASMLALGGVDGTIALWNTETLKILKKFPQVHELPVTCIAARPYSTPLQGDEEEGIVVHALSASADSKFALLTLQRRGPAKKRGNKSSSTTSFSIFPFTSACVWMALVSWVMYYVVLETQLKCRHEWNEGDYGQFAECVLHTVLIAPPSRPGILVPPH